MDIIKTLSIGIVIGMANVIPGVSGGTLAVVFNVYEKFIDIMSFDIKKIWANKKFVFPFLGGACLGMLIFSKLVTILYTHFPVQTNYFFLGLIIGSIPLLFNYALKKSANKKTSFRIYQWIILAICIAAGIAIIISFTVLEKKFSMESVREFVLPEFTIKLASKIFIAGILGAFAMVIPGISGSLLMLVLGVYQIIITAIPSLFIPATFVQAFILLLPSGLGILIGLVCGARLISWLLKKIPQYTYAIILGLIIGSACTLFPGFAGFGTVLTVITSILCVAGGFALAYFTSKAKSE